MNAKTKISKTTIDSAEKLSAQIVASIDDLLTEIFLLLPLNSVIRFKLVSKHWNSIISSPRFCVLRNHNPNPAVGLIFEYPNIDYQSIYANAHSLIPFLKKSIMSPLFGETNSIKDPWNRRVEILHSCNGLLVCGSKQIQKYYICNPTTKQYSKLPQVLDRGVSRTIHGMILAFDPSKSPHYKVVCVLGFRYLSEIWFQFEVYSSETGSWRKCGEPFTANVNFEDGVYWNGAVHWICFTGKSFYFNPNNDHDDQILPKAMPTPPVRHTSYWKRHRYFGESCDHLHYIDFFTCSTKPKYEFDVYEMRRDYSEWFVKYKFDLSYVVNVNDCFSVYALVRGKKDEDSFLVLWTKEKLMRYDLVYKTSETIHEFEDVYKHIFSSLGAKFPFQYIESLCSV